MIPVSQVRRVFVAEYKVSMRKGHDGLLAETYKMGLDPFAGDLVVFFGACRKRVKMIFADKNGLWLGYKKFFSGRAKTELNFMGDCSKRQISVSELGLLLDGASFCILDRNETSWNKLVGKEERV